MLKLLRVALATLFLVCGPALAAETGTGGPPITPNSGAASNCNVGAAGTGYYAGMTQAFCDDFNTFDFISAGNPTGSWTTTKIYNAGARGRQNILNKVYYVDPMWTGYRDYNRGVPLNWGNITVSGGKLTSELTKLTSQQINGTQGYIRTIGGTALSTEMSIWFRPVAGSPIYIENKALMYASQPLGWHPTPLWANTASQPLQDNNWPAGGCTHCIVNEVDGPEANSVNSYLNLNTFPGGGATSPTGPLNLMGQDNIYTIQIAPNTVAKLDINNAAGFASGTWNMNSIDGGVGRPLMLMMTNTVYNGTYPTGQETYSDSAWGSYTNGAKFDIDFVRIWQKTGTTKLVPLATVTNDCGGGPGGSISISGTCTHTLPAATTMWGKTPDEQIVMAVGLEATEQGNTDFFSFSGAYPTGNFPPGYSAGPGTVTVDCSVIAGGCSPGRTNMVYVGIDLGGTAIPARFWQNIACRWDMPSTVTVSNNQVLSKNIYHAAECGTLVTDANGNRAKTITLQSGTLPAGMGFSTPDGCAIDTFCGTITAANGSGPYNVTLRVTNSASQTTDHALTIDVTAQDSYITDSRLVALYNATDVTKDGTTGTDNLIEVCNIAAWCADSNLLPYKTLVTTGVAGTALQQVITGVTPSGKPVIRFTRNTGAANNRLEARRGDPVSMVAAGNTTPFTVIMAMHVTNTEIFNPVGWSQSLLNATNSREVITFNRNNGDGSSASNISFATAGSGGATANIGSGNPANNTAALWKCGTAPTCAATNAARVQGWRRLADGTHRTYNGTATSFTTGSTGTGTLSDNLFFGINFVFTSAGVTSGSIVPAMVANSGDWEFCAIAVYQGDIGDTDMVAFQSQINTYCGYTLQ